MKNIFHFPNFLEDLIRQLWKKEKLQSRSRLMCFSVPVVLTVLLVVVHGLCYTPVTAVPYVCLFSIVLISAGYGGGRGAWCATLITFLAAVGYQFTIASTDVVILFLYFAATLFLTAALHFFLRQYQHQDKQLISSQQTYEELLRMEKSHEDFVSMATHELKSPVTVLKAYIQLILLKMEKQGHADYPPMMEKMDIQVDKLLNLINDLQDATKVKSGSLNVLMNNFNINDSIRNSIDALTATHPEVIIEYDLVEPDPMIKGDRERIEQVITNFAGNGLKYSLQERRLKISSTLKAGWLRVAVTDFGLGIPVEKQAHVFERFYRVAEPQVSKLPGLGLGLFICKEIIKQHQGKIGVISEESKGSEFWFSLKQSED